MLLSHAREITYQGKRASLRAVRNNGCCYGELTVGRETFDVWLRADLYDHDDGYVLDRLARVVATGKGGEIEPTMRVGL